ncbi:hypothetical protein B0T21DRAFT_92934 [Apiosordaria backusii]|uniref:Heterokaryon incompatibility domain-containing protein n=1 Tax=Apiosordaria backusii TaxID=314023 RepID=A0AA40ESM6_9PEZI|nr:hypothetical protein B0T21DRAFT_92934 [Apiosordaria backusii]
MRAVYQNATLVIAAAGCKDATEGLHGIMPRPQPTTYSLPYYSAQGVVDGSYKVALLPDRPRLSGGVELDGPLRERAWAFQEWYLATRIVFFTVYGIYWKCRGLEVDELGCSQDSSCYNLKSWLEILFEYSGKFLTYPGDRLLALEGVVDLMREERKDSYRLGVWEKDLCTQLIWNMAGNIPPNTCNADYPSWCWAATGGKKHWPMEDLTFHNYPPPPGSGMILATELTCDGTIRSTGKLLEADIRTPAIRKCCFLATPQYEVPVETTVLSWYSLGLQPEVGPCRQHLILDPTDENNPFGIASFDRYLAVSKVLCLVIGYTHRKKSDPW